MTASTPARHTHAFTHIQSLPSWLAGRVAARGRSLVTSALSGLGLRLPHHAVLAFVSERGPVAQAEMVRELGFDAKDVVLLLNDLERAELAIREPDPRDRRKNAVRVTARGERTVLHCARLAERANAELLAPLSADDARHLVELLRRVQEGHRVPH
ncbi:MarR family winged helix-turn-helix transcriptional regulator [Streptomyces sp. NPDC047046]|uniref:MarR family winged helix-turn-helix transcriptional regulator n=1 Tax=Streptomyces sp. NPDC047046 TaxID=3155378 RepID=UPI0033E96A7F